MPKRVLLCILDGWGVSLNRETNALDHAKNWKNILKKYPYTLLQASEEYVGLPEGQMGNSEVGHMVIGLGRVIEQSLPRINKHIDDSSFQNFDNLKEMISSLKESGGVCHLLGLLSPGGVHSHQFHMNEIIKILNKHNIKVAIHAFLDGRDTPPQSALKYIRSFKNKLPENALFASVSGRYYAMDRDKRYERTNKFYDAMVLSNSEYVFNSVEEGVEFFYTQKVYDEFIPPFILNGYQGTNDQDALCMVNFRADRVIQILSALLSDDFDGFLREKRTCFVKAIGVTEYSKGLSRFIKPILPNISRNMGISECIALENKKQLHVAETEKYAHVTFFFNGGVEKPFQGEDRVLIPSPKVETYDLKPEMSAFDVLDVVCNAMVDDKYEFIVVNFANADMVGHTGSFPAVKKAVEVLDKCIEKIEKYSLKYNWITMITADHGNAEEMVDEIGEPHTAHTCNPVPFALMNSPYKKLSNTGTLSDIAPTILKIMGIKQPISMTGKSLICEMNEEKHEDIRY